jgi:hypothetical protein
MCTQHPVISTEDTESFRLAQDPEGGALLKDWAWFGLRPEPGCKWEDAITLTVQAIESLVERLSGPDLAVWLSLFGPFLPDGVLGAAHRLINSDDGCRFYLPEVEYYTAGPGYLETQFSIEWRPGYLARLFAPGPGAPSGILPCNCRVSVLFAPEAEPQTVGHHCLSIPELQHTTLTEDARIILKQCSYVIVPNLDFDFCYIGTRKAQAEKLGGLLRELWPSARWDFRENP